MHVYIVFAHPTTDTFNTAVLDAFTRGLHDAGHTFEAGDLYRMRFISDMDRDQYTREVGLDPDAPVPSDVQAEHEKIGRADALAFIYPIWWSDCPAKLKGWFDRVWSYGYAYFYGEAEERFTRVDIRKAVVICSAGHAAKHLEETGVADAMRTIMLDDRLRNIGVGEASMVILGGMMPKDDTFRQENLEIAYQTGRRF